MEAAWFFHLHASYAMAYICNHKQCNFQNDVFCVIIHTLCMQGSRAIRRWYNLGGLVVVHLIDFGKKNYFLTRINKNLYCICSWMKKKESNNSCANVFQWFYYIYFSQARFYIHPSQSNNGGSNE